MRTLTAWLECLMRVGKCFRWQFQKHCFAFRKARNPQKSANGYRDCLSGEPGIACCPARLVLKMHFPSEKKEENTTESETFYRTFVFLSFAFHDLLISSWEIRENLCYILLELIEFRMSGGKSLPGKIVFHRYRLLVTLRGR